MNIIRRRRAIVALLWFWRRVQTSRLTYLLNSGVSSAWQRRSRWRQLVETADRSALSSARHSDADDDDDDDDDG